MGSAPAVVFAAFPVHFPFSYFLSRENRKKQAPAEIKGQKSSSKARCVDSWVVFPPHRLKGGKMLLYPFCQVGKVPLFVIQHKLIVSVGCFFVPHPRIGVKRKRWGWVAITQMQFRKNTTATISNIAKTKNCVQTE